MGGEEGTSTKETEMSSKPTEEDLKSLAISPKMSAPTIKVVNRTKVTGNGLALAVVSIEQDAAYWEWHCELDSEVHIVEDAMFGVASKKDKKFFADIAENGAANEGERMCGWIPICECMYVQAGSQKHLYSLLVHTKYLSIDSYLGTDWMRKIEVQDKDVIGVAVQQSDLPMVQLTLNGELLHESAINRFRGTVYPSIHLPLAHKTEFRANLVLQESKFKEMSPGAKFGPVIVARSIV